MFKIKTKGYEIILDSKEDCEFFKHSQGDSVKKIYFSTCGSKTYAYFSYKGKNINMSHIFCGRPIKGYVVDHINGNSLDNRRSNLRVVTYKINNYNKPVDNKAKKRWVIADKNGKYMARIQFHLGTYDTADEAHEVALNFMKKVHPNIIVAE